MYSTRYNSSSIFNLLCAEIDANITTKKEREVVINMKQRVWGVRSGHSHEIVAQIISYMQSHPANYCNQMDTLLELIYQAYTEFNSVETSEFKAIVNPLDQTLRSLVDTDEEADSYMNIVFELCTAYERQSYIEGMKVGMRLMAELMER